MNRIKFGHLHVHSAYSLLDSTIRIEAAVRKVSADGQTFMALSDHGTLAGIPKHVETCNRYGIKPVIGCEFYVAPDTRHRHHYHKGDLIYTHLILLAKTSKGWDNLRTLSTLSYVEGHYKRPRIDHELIARYSEGLIATTACIGGDISAHLVRGLSDEEGEGKTEYDPDLAAAKVAWYASHFGKDFYIELQEHGEGSTQQAVNDWYRARYPEEMIFASADCHYINAEDADTHDTLLCCNVHKPKDDPTRWRFPTDQCWLKTTEEMSQLFSDVELENTQKIADSVEFELPLRKQWFMPELPADILEGGYSPEEVFTRECIHGLMRRFFRDPSYGLEESYEAYTADAPIFREYKERLDYEMSVFIKAGFIEYALILWDLMDWCKRNDIMTGDGRGSGAGSLVLYALGITNVDPVLRGCPFERFINPGRLENFAPPDVDLDFPQSRRQDVIAYLRARYGHERVCQIGTYANLGAAGVVKKLKVPLGIDDATGNRIAAIIPQGEGGTAQGSGAASEEQGMSLDDVYRGSEAFRKEIDKLDARVFGKETGAWLMHYARGLRGLGDHASTHASGLLITDRPVSEIVPLMVAKVRTKDELTLAQFDMFDAEKMGLVKFDVLGIVTIDALQYTERMIQMNDDIDFSFNDIDLDDPKAYDLLSSGRTVGIFQAEGGGLGRLIPQTKPRNIEELAILNSLCRPGPMLSPTGTASYIRRKQGVEPVTYLIPQLEPILKRSLGIVAFQEDIMAIAHQLAGFTLAEADELRKVMGKKQLDKMPKYKQKFTDGLVAVSNVTLEKAEELWELLLPMAQYVFNKSHAIGYSYTTAKCAYAKAHYPAYFLAGTMTGELTKSGGGDALPALVRDAQSAGCTMLPPDINKSEFGYAALDAKTILLGFISVKGCGKNSATAILAEREANGPFKSVEDLRMRVKPADANATVLRSLQNAGAFDALEGVEREPTPERLQEEFELFGFYLTGHICGKMRDAWLEESPDLVTLANVNDDWRKEPTIRYWGNQRKRVMLYGEKHVRAVVTKIERKKSKKSGNFFWMLNLEDETGSMNTTLFSQTMERFGNPTIAKGDILDFVGRKSERYEGDVEITSRLEVVEG